MAVSTTDTYSGPYEANGATVEFPFTFKAVSADDVAVIIRTADGEESFAPTSDYSVSLDVVGGSAIFSTPPDDVQIYVVSEPSFLQQIEFASGQPFSPSVVNDVNDLDVVRALYLKREMARTPRLPLGGGVTGKYPYVKEDGTFGWTDGPGLGDPLGDFVTPEIPNGSSAKEALEALGAALGSKPTSRAVVVASEGIGAGDFVNIYGAAGESRVRKAWAGDPARFANGFAPSAIANGQAGAIFFAGLNSSVAVPDDASEAWLSDVSPGSFMTIPPASGGSIVQSLGPAIAGLGIFFTFRERVLL
jgi:hypothetical protein